MPEEKFSLSEMQDLLNKQVAKTGLPDEVEDTDVPDIDEASVKSLSPYHLYITVQVSSLSVYACLDTYSYGNSYISQAVSFQAY